MARQQPRVPGAESLADAAVAEAFDRVTAMPQMRMLRSYVAGRALALSTAGEAVDLGCGSGRLAVDLAKRAPGLHVTGIDLSEAMIGLAGHRAAEEGLGARVAFKNSDVNRLPFVAGSVDLVVSSLSLHHWSRPLLALDEVCRVLRRPDPVRGRPGGSYFLLDLRRDLALPSWLLLYCATRLVVPSELRAMREPLASSEAAYTPDEAVALLSGSRLSGWSVTSGPLWLTIEGTITGDACGVPVSGALAGRPVRRPVALAGGLD